MAQDANATKAVGLAMEAANADTVYRDFYLRRARQLLSPALDESAYRSIGSTEAGIEEVLRRSRTAVLQRDWAQAAELSGQIDSMRHRLEKMGKLAAIGKEVYEAEPFAFDPFSPGKHLGANAQASQASHRTHAIDALAALAKLDGGARLFYETRRSYFSGLDVKSAAPQKGAQRDRAQAEKLALEAAERGDTGVLQRLAKELRDWKESKGSAPAGTVRGLSGRYESSIDLSAPFSPQVIDRAKAFGLAEARTAPYPEFTKVREIIYMHVDQPLPSDSDMEREGVVHARTMAENELPAGFDSEEPRILAGQFIQQIFVNSGGARYLPPLAKETVLLEDFAENESDADAPSKLLTALGLAKRGGLSRTEIESALMRAGAEVLENSLGLDPLEFRLVCIPYDLYARSGRERGFGKWRHWTHFDGYQVMAGNRLRALAGGDGRFGGLCDLVSISPRDARAGVYARFAVVRRARMTLRWR